MIPKPQPGQYPEFYQPYIDAVDSDDLINCLKSFQQESQQLFGAYPKAKWDYRYEEDKWCLREILGHLCDAERVFATRAMRFSRNDHTPLPGFDQDLYVPESNVAHRPVPDLLEEFSLIRKSTLKLFENFTEEMLNRRGQASGWDISVAGIGYVIAGHERHHQRVFKERYT